MLVNINILYNTDSDDGIQNSITTYTLKSIINKPGLYIIFKYFLYHNSLSYLYNYRYLYYCFLVNINIRYITDSNYDIRNTTTTSKITPIINTLGIYLLLFIYYLLFIII